MDVNTVIPAFVGLFCGIRLVQGLQNRTNTAGWIIIFSVMLGLAAGSYYLFRDYAAILSGIPFLLLVVIPLYSARNVTRLLERQRYQSAYWLSLLSYLLHPLDHWRGMVVMTRALLLGSQDKFAEAFHILDQYGHPEFWYSDYARVELYRLDADWETMRRYLEYRPNPLNQLFLIHFYIRSLGETGDPNAMLAAYAKHRDTLVKHIPFIKTTLLFIYALSGQQAQTERIAKDKRLPESIRRSWIATAALTGGDEAVGKQEITALLGQNDPRSQALLQRRLDFHLPRAENVLTPESRSILAQVDADLQRIEDYETKTSADTSRPYATYALIAINCIVFLFEARSGRDTFRTLIKMGALVPELVIYDHEWWRLINSMFLHFDVLHLSMNMLALWVFGPLIERIVGLPRFIIIYFIAGLVPGLLMVVLAQRGLIELDIVAAGASGAIMGLIGAEGAIMWRARRNGGSKAVRDRLRWIAFIIVLEVVFDLGVLSAGSMFVHLCGAVFGFIATSFVKHRPSRRTLPG